ncbi:MAG: nucleoside monophosphate kinase [Candidatus Omnitrophota bacterium]
MENGVSKKRIVVFFGPPGVGKGTIATRLAAEFGFRFVSSGDLLRDSVKNKTELGSEAKCFMDAGGLVPDGLVTRMVLARLDEVNGGVFLDGFPRTKFQAEEFKSYVDKKGLVLLVINLEASDGFLMERLSQRLICRNCGAIYHRGNLPPKKEGTCDVCAGVLYQREDDQPEVVAKRLTVYHQQSAPLREYYQRAGLMVTLRGDQLLPETLAGARQILMG